MNVSIEAAIDSSGEPDARARIAALVAALSDGMAGSLPLGRKLIKLTVDAPPSARNPSAAIAASAGSSGARTSPLAARPDRFERLVSALAVVIGWEAFVVLFDVRGLSVNQAREIITGAATTLVDAALAQAGAGTGAGTGAAGTGAGTDSDSPN
jgi:hypothetical protein